MTSEQLTATVQRVLESAPVWIKTELTSNDPAIRRRAEEALVAKIAVALADDESEP